MRDERDKEHDFSWGGMARRATFVLVINKIASDEPRQ